MQKETYERVFAKIRSKENGVKRIQILGQMLTYATALCYIAAIVGGFFETGWRSAVVIILVPAVSFLAVSVFRKCYNAKRPYEIYGFTPLIVKDTKGKSFPSRHVFSIFVIGSTMLWVYPVIGSIICFMGCILAVIRVVVGVHFPKDVIVGSIIGIVCGCMTGVFL